MSTPNNPYGSNDLPDYGSYQNNTPANNTPGNDFDSQLRNAHDDQAGAYPYGGGYQSDYAVDPTPQKNKAAIWSLVLGIVAVLMSLTFALGIFAIIPALIGLIVGLVGLKRSKQIIGKGSRKGLTIAGIIISIIGLLLSIFIWYVLLRLGTEAMEVCGNQGTTAELSECVTDFMTEKLETTATN